MKTWSQHRYEVKNHAKKSLVGRFLKCAIAFVISFVFGTLALSRLPFQVPNAISQNTTPEALLAQILPNGFTHDVIVLIVVSMFLYLLLIAPLSIGIWRYLLLASRGETPKLRSIFLPFFNLKEVFSACILTVLVSVFQIFWAVILFIIPIALSAFSPMLGPLAKLGGDLLLIIASILYAIVCTPYILAPIALAEMNEPSPLRAISVAHKKARGAKREFLVFRLSFILWYLFAFSFPGAFFVRPYIDMATARFYDTIDECKTKEDVR